MDKQIAVRTPNMNAHAERVIQTLQRECLDRFIVLGARHLAHLTAEFTRHYNQERPHSGIGLQTPVAAAGVNGLSLLPPWTVPREKAAANVICRDRLGGVLKHYQRKAACRVSPS